MPMIKVLCSSSVDKAAKERLALSLSKDVAKAMSKPEAYVQAIVEDGSTIAFGGSLEPSAFVALRGVGGISPDSNKTLSKAICAELSSQLSIDPARIYINFESFKGSDWGWNGGTF